MTLTKNCNICSDYLAEEIGDSDYGVVYSDELICDNGYNLDEEENPYEDFNRDIERVCYRINFWKALEKDEELNVFTENEFDYDKSFGLFKKKYNVV